MTDPVDIPSALELRNLQYAYASALDRRDSAALCAVFRPDATLRMFDPDADEPRAELRGHEQLALMPEAMGGLYAKTMHVITNCMSSIDGEEATGQAYCVAHHLILDDGAPRQFAVNLVYEDHFRRSPGDTWRISRRDIRFLWAEESRVLNWETALVRGRLR